MTSEYFEGYQLALADQREQICRAFPVPLRSYDFSCGYADGKGIPRPTPPETVGTDDEPTLATSRPINIKNQSRWPDHQVGGWWHGGE